MGIVTELKVCQFSEVLNRATTVCDIKSKDILNTYKLLQMDSEILNV